MHQLCYAPAALTPVTYLRFKKKLDQASEAAETTPTPTPTAVPTPEPTPTANSPEELEYIEQHFDILDIDLPVPEWVKEWGDYQEDQQSGRVVYGSYSIEHEITISAFLADDGIDDLTGEPVVYDEYYFDDADPKDIVSWSDENGLFKIHHSSDDLETFVADYRDPDYSVWVKIHCPTEEADKYEEVLNHICEAAMSVSPDPQLISEEEIVEFIQKKYGSPLAEIDHYEGYKPVVHLYELVDDGYESHSATWGWVTVDPITGMAIDDFTLDSFIIPGADFSFE